jgi:hypothetical protein
MGFADTLRVDKCDFTLGVKTSQKDTLSVQGAIAAADTSVDMAEMDVIVRWGSYSIVLPAENLYRLGKKMSFKYTKSKGSNSPVAAALFDLEKCTFKIVIANADIGSQGNPVDFSIQFGFFQETTTLPLTQKNGSMSVYP